MIYPVITDNFDLDVWNANFSEIQNYMNTTSENLTSSELGTVTYHRVIKNGKSVRYQLSALSGTWTSETNYIVCTIPSAYRPSISIDKTIILRTNSGVPVCANLYINTTGAVYVKPKTSITALAITIDETFLI